MGGFAWVTLATNDSYSLGALVLAHSLKAVRTTQQLAVLVTPGVTSAMRDKLAAVFNLVQEVNILDSRDEANLRLLKRPELGITFTKLHCWRLTQFEKCVFLDADTLVLQYCDELFEREELSAAPDVGWPDCFNSGVFVYRPSLETYDKLIQFALEKGSFDGGDQGLLNLYFSDWAHKDISRHLPFIYNMCSTACYSYLPAFKQFGANAKIIHFIGAQKPWLQYFNTETRNVQPSADSSHLQEVLQRWWDIFCSLIHPHLSPAMPQGQLQHAVSPSYFPPQYAPPSNPTSSADDYENAWDPWDEYDQKIAQKSHYTSVSTHYIQNQPIESLNTNASHVADQPTIHSQPQSHNYNTYSAQNNSFYQPIPQPVYKHVPRVFTPPPSPQPQHHHVPRVSTPPPSPQPQHHHEPQYHPQEPSYNRHTSHHPAPQHYYPKPQHQSHEPQNHESQPQYHHQEHYQPESQNHNPEPQYQQTHHHHHHHHHQHQEHVHQSPPPKHDQTHYEHPQHIDNHQHSNHPPQQSFHQNDHLHSHQNKAESFPSGPDRPGSPDHPDPVPILPKECEATTTVSNDMSLSSTIEDCSKQDNAGLAGAFAQLTLGVPRTAEQDAFENVLRKQAWEVGNIDYLGRDSFENIWSKIAETLDAAPPQLPAVPAALAVEPELSAPAQSQTETAPPEEEAKPVQSPVIPTDTAPPADSLKVDSTESSSPAEVSKDQPQILGESLEAPIIPTSKEIVEPGKPQPQVSEKKVVASPDISSGDSVEVISSTESKNVKEGDSSQPQPLPDVSSTQKEKESIVEPAVCPVPQKKEAKGEETKASEPQTEVSQPETKAADFQTDAPATETKAPDASPTETKVPEPQTDVSEKPKENESVAQACPIPQTKELQIKAAEPVSLKETETVVESVCPLPEKKEVPKETEEQVIAPQPKKKELKTPSSKSPQTEAPKDTLPDQEVAKVTSQSQEAPKVISEVQETPKESTSAAIKESETLSQSPPRPTEVPQQTEDLPEKSEVSAPPPESVVAPPDSKPSPAAPVPKKVTKSKTKEVAAAAELTAAAADSSSSVKATSKVAPSKDSPKTKVTEATPPVTPGSPVVEKTKESLAAEANIPDTPPPSEGGSTPTPPPRKTDKPKKVAAKPKK